MNLHPTFSSLSCHYHMITQDNKLMGWGANWCGGVGNGNKEACTEPVEIPLPQPATTKEIRSMAAGWHHTLCLMEDGSLFAWGDNSFGQLGVGDNISRYAPVELRMPNDLPVTQVTCGKGFSLAVTEDGTLFSWGENSDGQLGRGETTNQNTPQKVNLSDVLFMSAGRDHVYAKTPTATYAWGYNVSRQFGFSDADNRETPTQVSHLPDLVKIFCGGYHNLGLDSNGNLWSWGRNGEGQLGLGDLASHDHPEKIPGLPKMVSAAAGMEHSLALTEDKRVFAWGENSQGQLGISSSERYVLTPTEVSMPDVAFVFAGSSDSAAITEDGKLFVFRKQPRLRSGYEWLTPDTKDHKRKWQVARWLWEGRTENASIFYLLPDEVLYHLVHVLCKNNI